MYADVQPVVDAAFQLLDRQILDRDDVPVGKVDDLECATGDDGSVVVTALLCGPGAWGPRIGGRLGEWIVAVWTRFHPAAHPEPTRVPCEVIARIDSAVHLDVARDVLATHALSEWVQDHLIDGLPGADHASA